MWHVAAIATVYDLSLDDVLSANRKKLNELSNLEGESPSPLYDDGDNVPSGQRLPRQFEIAFVSVDEGRLQMYYNGAALGDELTDNSWRNDGYRFHDIMHLANVAKLGWSPVLRHLMKRKRRYDPDIDSAEDGARARIVEEVVVKAIHSEGERVGGSVGSEGVCPVTLFTTKEQIPFSLLKLIGCFVKGLEVEKSRNREWKEAIIEGHKIYASLFKEGQGTVRVDMTERSIQFDPHVNIPLRGVVVGAGSANSRVGGVDLACLSPQERLAVGGDPYATTKAILRKRAILDALGLPVQNLELFGHLTVVELGDGNISVKASGDVQKVIWSTGVISFRPMHTDLNEVLVCHAIALADPDTKFDS